MRFLNNQATAFQVQFLIPCIIVDVAVLAKVATKLQKSKQYCSSETSLLAELTVLQAKWRSEGESHLPNKVS